MSDTLHGRCLCGAVRYEITTPLVYMAHCHCTRCRQFHGACMSTYVPVPAHGLHIRQGPDLLATYQDSTGQSRTFCTVCGSSLFANYGAQEPDLVSVAAGTLVDDPGVRPSVHLHTASKAPWFDITDGLPQIAGEWA